MSEYERNDAEGFIRTATAAGQVLQATFSQPRSKEAEAPSRVSVRPVRLKNGLFYQFERQVGNKALHGNLPPEEAAAEMARLIADDFRQALVKTPDADVQVLVSKKGKAALLRKPPTSKSAAARPPGAGVSAAAPAPASAGASAAGPAAALLAESHNRAKSYVLPEGEPVPFLIELGVMNAEGKVVKAKFDKFRQINRFLEMVADARAALPEGKELQIVDFGCGKSYLTFALYHYLAIKEGLNVRIFGLDLKKDVIETCSRLAERLGWDRLTFAVGDISAYKDAAEVDMVVTLHACDTATDAALLQAIGWNAGVILSVPCCQHELFGQLSQPILKPLLKHGLLKERFAALVTDAARAQLLEMAGYRVQLLEFIDIEHTPKNLLIRAVRTGRAGREDAAREYAAMRDFLGISPYMENRAEGPLAEAIRSSNSR